MENLGSNYNNADSFAIIFDAEWKKSNFQNKKNLTIEEKIQDILERNKDHPFIKSSPSKAFEVAKFRLRLLQLE